MSIECLLVHLVPSEIPPTQVVLQFRGQYKFAVYFVWRSPSTSSIREYFVVPKQTTDRAQWSHSNLIESITHLHVNIYNWCRLRFSSFNWNRFDLQIVPQCSSQEMKVTDGTEERSDVHVAYKSNGMTMVRAIAYQTFWIASKI